MTEHHGSKDQPNTTEKLLEEVKNLISGERNWIANFSNTASLLFWDWNPLKNNKINWLGFYVVDAKLETQLVLGPFHGKPACIRIEFHRGVCGKCARERKSVVVPNVHEFPGHIACDSASNSEIVVPLLRSSGERPLIGVLDVDSSVLHCFDDNDRIFLENVARVLVDGSDFP